MSDEWLIVRGSLVVRGTLALPQNAALEYDSPR
jgi:hypothetical protein